MKKETLLIVIFIWISISTYALNNKNRSKTKSNSSVILKHLGVLHLQQGSILNLIM